MKYSFKIPLQSEVEMYMKEKKGWPESFIKYYAEKFWNHYQASGWKLSSGNSMKDWKACFNSQWQTPKFKEDIDKLNFHSLKIVPMNHTIKEIKELDELLGIYARHPTQIPFEDFGKYYEFLGRHKLLKPLTQDQINSLREAYQGNNYKCRCAHVQLTISGYIDSGYTFAQVLDLREKKSKAS